MQASAQASQHAVAVTTRQLELESAWVAMVATQEQAYATNTSHTMAAVETAYLQNVATVVDRLWSLSDELLFKYASGFVNTDDEMSQMVGYPAWWLQAVGYSQGPPPPPTKPKCCHPPKKQEQQEPEDLHHHHHHDDDTTSTSSSGNSNHADTDPVRLTGKAAMRNHLRATASS